MPTLQSLYAKQGKELPLLTISLRQWLMEVAGDSEKEYQKILSDQVQLASYQFRYTYARRLKELYSYKNKTLQRKDRFFLNLAITYQGK